VDEDAPAAVLSAASANGLDRSGHVRQQVCELIVIDRDDMRLDRLNER
jgi:hypothetical protein